VLLFCYGLRPLLIYLLSVSPNNGRLATKENQNVLNIGTFVFFAIAFWIYSLIVKSFKVQKAAKSDTEDEITLSADSIN